MSKDKIAFTTTSVPMLSSMDMTIGDIANPDLWSASIVTCTKGDQLSTCNELPLDKSLNQRSIMLTVILPRRYLARDPTVCRRRAGLIILEAKVMLTYADLMVSTSPAR